MQDMSRQKLLLKPGYGWATILNQRKFHIITMIGERSMVVPKETLCGVKLNDDNVVNIEKAVYPTGACERCLELYEISGEVVMKIPGL